MVSLGAGDYELATIKALKALEKSDVICIPTKDKEGSFEKSLTYEIVKDLMKEFQFTKPLIPVYTPMKFKNNDWERQVDVIMEQFEKNKVVSFVTLGDAGVYSTVYYLLEIIERRDKKIADNCEVIAGVTSFSYASSQVKKPLCLGDSKLEIIPLVSPDSPPTKVYMRPKKGMDTEVIEETGEIYTFEDLNFKTEQIIKGKKKRVEGYMTLFIDFVKGLS
ncbi:MAG: precorrin-2 C(20)-methyltransferase [Campylobacterales bacterium]|nr:precorrin-2 C(20)-methyltransferase [Campylobacterales bacterium]